MVGRNGHDGGLRPLEAAKDEARVGEGVHTAHY